LLSDRALRKKADRVNQETIQSDRNQLMAKLDLLQKGLDDCNTKIGRLKVANSVKAVKSISFYKNFKKKAMHEQLAVTPHIEQSEKAVAAAEEVVSGEFQLLVSKRESLQHEISLLQAALESNRKASYLVYDGNVSATESVLDSRLEELKSEIATCDVEIKSKRSDFINKHRDALSARIYNKKASTEFYREPRSPLLQIHGYFDDVAVATLTNKKLELEKELEAIRTAKYDISKNFYSISGGLRFSERVEFLKKKIAACEANIKAIKVEQIKRDCSKRFPYYSFFKKDIVNDSSNVDIRKTDVTSDLSNLIREKSRLEDELVSVVDALRENVNCVNYFDPENKRFVTATGISYYVTGLKNELVTLNSEIRELRSLIMALNSDPVNLSDADTNYMFKIKPYAGALRELVPHSKMDVVRTEIRVSHLRSLLNVKLSRKTIIENLFKNTEIPASSDVDTSVLNIDDVDTFYFDNLALELEDLKKQLVAVNSKLLSNKKLYEARNKKIFLDPSFYSFSFNDPARDVHQHTPGLRMTPARRERRVPLTPESTTLEKVFSDNTTSVDERKYLTDELADALTDEFEILEDSRDIIRNRYIHTP